MEFPRKNGHPNKLEKMKKKIRLLRICYWWGIIADALAAIVMLSPTLAGLVYAMPNFNPGSDYKYAMGMGAFFIFTYFYTNDVKMEKSANR